MQILAVVSCIYILCDLNYLGLNIGDSGGPIQQNLGNCTFELMAITSYGGVCSFGEGAVYTRISSYISWIESIVWN